METKLKTLQKLLKNKKIPYIFLRNNRLYATTGGDLAVYDCDINSIKSWDINNLTEVEKQINEFPKLEYAQPILDICRDELEVNKKDLVNTLKEIKEYINNNKENIDDKEIVNIEISKEAKFIFKVLTKYEIKQFIIPLPHKHIMYTEFKEKYLWNNIYKYAKLCKGKVIKIKYAGNCSQTPLIFNDMSICEYATMPVKLTEV